LPFILEAALADVRFDRMLIVLDRPEGRKASRSRAIKGLEFAGARRLSSGYGLRRGYRDLLLPPAG